MARSAARVVATVVADVCDMDSSSASFDDVASKVTGLYAQLVHYLDGSPDAATVTAVDRAIEAGARQLSTLGTRLAAVVRRGNAASVMAVEWQLTEACTLVSSLVRVAVNHQMVIAAVAIRGCVSPLLECGLALITRPAAVSGSANIRTTAGMLESQAELLDTLVVFPEMLHPNFVAHLLTAPEPLLAWMAAAVPTVLALRLHDRGPPSMVPLYFANLVNTMCLIQLLRPHYLALQRDTDLQRSLVEVLLPALHAAGVAMQLPPDRRPNCHFSWGMSTSRLFAAASASCPDELMGSSFARWYDLSALLATTCLQLSKSIQQQQLCGAAVPDAQRQKTVRLLLQAVPRLPTVLWEAAKRCREDASGCADAASISCFWRTILSTINSLKVSEPGLSADRRIAAADSIREFHVIDSLAEVPAWCSAAAALLRALPHAMTVAALAQLQPATEEQPNAATVHATQLVVRSWSLAFAIVNEIAAYCDSIANGGPWSAADAAVAREALWQLHTALCRSIQSVAAGGLQSIAMPVSMLSVVLCAAAHVPAAADGGTATSAARPANGKQRHLMAMSVAHAEAMLAAANLPPAPADESVAAGLLFAVKHGPAALVRSPPMQQALEGLAERLGAAAEGSALAASLCNEVVPLPHREPQPGDALELAQSAADRSCAYLCCANLAGEGGPAAGQGAGSMRCSKCRVAWYCGTACSHADWRAGHRRVCRALRAARLAEQEFAED